MDLVYFRLSSSNFGDDLNLWIWDDLIPGWRDWAPGRHLMGVGTILNDIMTPPGPKLVLGSGAGYGRIPDVSGPDWDVRAVRGPLTAAALGLPAEAAICDPAVLLPRIDRFAGLARGDETLFVPHHASDAACDWPAVCARAGVAYQSPSADAETVIRRLAGARRVIAESMHAAIIADAFGVPWTAVALSAEFNPNKWRDWSLSLGMDDPGIRQFYRGLRAAQRLKQRLLPRRPAPATPPATSPATAAAQAAAGHDTTFHIARRRKPYLEPLAVLELRRARRARFRLTDRAAVAAAQERFLARLREVSDEYGRPAGPAPDAA